MTTDKASDRSKTPEEQFPIKLHRILDDAETEGFSDIITWMPGGTSFKILDKNKLESEVMPRYFSSCRFKSFQRSLNLWGFMADNKRSDSITGVGRRHHPMFIKGKPELCAKMSRIRVKEPGSRAAVKTTDASRSPKSTIHKIPEQTEIPVQRSFPTSHPGILQTSPTQHGLIPSHRPTLIGDPNRNQICQNPPANGLLTNLLKQSLSHSMEKLTPAVLDALLRQQQQQQQQQVVETFLLESTLAKYLLSCRGNSVAPQAKLSLDKSCRQTAIKQHWDLASAILLLQQQQNQR